MSDSVATAHDGIDLAVGDHGGEGPDVLPPSAGRAGPERHVRTMAAEHANVRLEAIVATHGVIFGQPGEIAAMIRALVTA